MKILHTSDLHFGIAPNGQPFDDVQKEMIDNILLACEKEGINGVIFAGDLFDRAITSANALTLYNDLITRLSAKGVSIFEIAGNHDSPERLSNLSEILKKSDVYISGKFMPEIPPLHFGNADIYLIPYFNLDTARAVFPEENFSDYDEAFSFVTTKILGKADKSKFNIAVSHCFVSGGQLSESDRSARIGNAQIVPASVFEGFDYTALGHLHGPHFVGEKIRYSGTPYPYSFGEKFGEKTFTIIDTESGAISYFTPKYSKNMRVIEKSYLEILEDSKTDEHKEDYVKIVLTDKYASGDIFNELREIYPNILSFEGIMRKDAISVSTLKAESLETLTPMEILKSFLSENEELLGDLELKVFNDAVKEVEGI